MTNPYLQAVADIERNKWCVDLRCSTCHAQDFRSAVSSIPDLQSALLSLDLESLISHKNWNSALRITVMDHRLSVDWGLILSSWLSYAQDHVDFADKVWFYIVNRSPCDRETRSKWLEMCVGLAIRTRHTSLLESLVRILGPRTSDYGDLLVVSLEEAPRSSLLTNALVKAGFLPSAEDIKREKSRDIAGQRLFGAIRRNDIKAVKALLAKGANLSVKDGEGRTVLEYAKSRGCEDVVVMIGGNDND